MGLLPEPPKRLARASLGRARASQEADWDHFGPGWGLSETGWGLLESSWGLFEPASERPQLMERNDGWFDLVVVKANFFLSSTIIHGLKPTKSAENGIFFIFSAFSVRSALSVVFTK